MTGTAKPIDWDGQRAHLTDLRDKTLAELRDLAERRKTLALDLELGIGTAKQADLDRLEATMADKTAAADRLKDSLVELDRRQRASDAQTAAAARRALEKQMEGRLARLGALGAQLADHVVEIERLLADVAVVEREVLALGGRLDRQLPLGASRKSLLAKALIRLDVRVPPFFVSPHDAEKATERLRQTPVLVPTFGHAASEPQRGEVPYVDDPPPAPVQPLGAERIDRELAAEDELAAMASGSATPS